MSVDPRVRRVLAVTVGTAVALCLAPVVASAATPTVGIGVARTDDDQRGSFTVPAWTDATGASVTTVSATIRDGSSVVATEDLASTGSGAWAPSAPLALTDDGGPMPHLGDYAVDVTATDSAGNTLTRTGAGTLDFTLRPVFVADQDGNLLGFDPSPLTYTAHSPAVLGRLMGIRPGSGASVPLAGRTVTVRTDAAGDTPGTATTDSTGAFRSAPVTLAARGLVSVAFAADDAAGADATHGRAALDEVSAPYDVTTLTVSATADRTHADPGTPITISGTASLPSGPLADGSVRVSMTSNDAGSVIAPTDANGHFSATLVAVHQAAGVSWSVTPTDGYLEGSGGNGVVVVPAESSLTGTAITQSATGTVSATPTLRPQFASYDPIYDAQTVRIEFSANGRTGWTTVATAPVQPGTPIALATKNVVWIHGYFRLHHPSSDDLADIATTPVYLSRYQTRIVGVDATPEPARKGQTLTVRASVQYYNQGWHVLHYVPVELFFLPKGGTRFGYVAAGRADANGRIAIHAKATVAGTYSMQYFGTPGLLDSYADGDYIDVR